MKRSTIIIRVTSIVFVIFTISSCMAREQMGLSTAESSTPPTTFIPTQVLTKTNPATANITPTIPVIATFTAIDAQAGLMDWLLHNDGCLLPCIWGLTPGITDVQMVQAHLAPFGSGVDYPVVRTDQRNFGSIGFFPFSADGLTVNVGLDYYYEKGVIKYLVLHTLANRGFETAFGEPVYQELLHNYLLQGLLTTYGHPSEVLIATWPPDSFVDEKYIEPFIVVIVYSDLGIMAEYSAPSEYVNGNYQGCPDQGLVTIMTWNPSLNISLRDVAAMNPSPEGINENSIDFFKPLEEATSMTLDDFYRSFQLPTDKCIETPTNLWPMPER